MRYLTFALAKGRLAKETLKLLEKTGITCEEINDPKTRKLIFQNDELGVRFFLSKPSDVPTYVEYGVADIGVVGRDTLLEEGRNLYEEIKGGYIDRMSFAFTVNEESYDKAEHQWNVRGVKRLYDVSAVSIPAYDDTSISARKNFILEAEAQEKEKRAAEAALAERKENLLKRLNKGENK